MPATPAGRHAHIGAVLAASVLWGTTGTIAHYAPAGSNHALVGISTFGFGGLALLALDSRPVGRLLTDRSTWPLLLVGALGVGAYAGFYYWGMALVGVAIGNVLALGSGPVFAALLELVIDKRPIGPAWAVATAVSVLGIALLGASASSAPGPNPVGGVVLALASGFGYALYSWAAARLIGRGHRSRSVMAALFAVTAVVLVPAFLMAGPGPLLQPRGLAILAYLALIPMALAYLLFGYGLRGLAASAATTLALAEPVVATVLATVILREQISAIGWLGIALIVVGLLLVARAERRVS
ncbi:MAG: EamA family transporter [Tetrasphaera sp.]